MAPLSERRTPLRLGVFGGTFDPPHLGHTAVARDVADALKLDSTLWIPARIPPHKQDEIVTAPHLRMEMVSAAVAPYPDFAVSDVEFSREGPSYTVDTLRELRHRHPGAELYLLLGADQVGTLRHGWREPEEVLRLATLALMDREGERTHEAVPDLPGIERAVHVPVRRVDVSGTRIRSALAAGKDVTRWMSAGVLRIIQREGLYRP
jgi:nicotinate-nucleotide adenylyltransferase